MAKCKQLALLPFKGLTVKSELMLYRGLVNFKVSRFRYSHWSNVVPFFSYYRTTKHWYLGLLSGTVKCSNILLLGLTPAECLNEMYVFCLTFMCSCNEGYEGAYCQVAATAASELPLLIGLSTLLPIAAILVVIITIILVYRRLRAREIIGDGRQHRNNIRATARYDVSIHLMQVLRCHCCCVGNRLT